jgi:hypothetical protein
MTVFNGAFPVLPGQEDAGRAFAKEVLSSRRQGFEALQRRSGVSRETWSIQESPMGALMLVWFEAPDIEASFTDLATSNDEFSVWFRDRVKELTGVDLAEPAEGGPEVVLEWNAP